MESFYSRFKNPLVLIALLAAQTIGLAMQVERPASAAAGTRTATGLAGSAADALGVSILRSWAVAIVSPFERLGHEAMLRSRIAWNSYIDLRHTRQQNIALQDQIGRLRLEQAAFAEDAAEGRRLQSLLAFKQQYISSTVAAQVIGTSGSDRSRLVYLDKGSADGLQPDMPVITPDGVVGKLRNVSAHTAQLLLLNDLTSGAGVTLVSTRIRGIVQGAPGGHIVIDDLTADSRIQPGERIITSGGDGVFPRGLPVGVIQSIAPDPLHQPYTAIVVQPFANLARLEEVLVVTGLSQTLTAQARQDADQAGETAAADDARRAADILAQKLPGLDKPAQPAAPDASPANAASSANLANVAPAPDPNAADRGGVPGVPNSGLPRTRPALHPDRYSPGTTPPATDLTPGAPK